MAVATAIIAAAIGAAGAAYSVGEGVKAQKKAAKRAEKQQAPYRKAAEASLEKMSAITARGPGGPMYQWRRQEEEAALEARMRAAGTFSSGRMLEASRDIGQRLTAEESEAHYARLESMAELGAGQMSPQPYYQAAAAETTGAGVVGQQISGLAGTWLAERRRREEEERRRRLVQARDTGGYSLGRIEPSIMTA